VVVQQLYGQSRFPIHPSFCTFMRGVCARPLTRYICSAWMIIYLLLPLFQDLCSRYPDVVRTGSGGPACRGVLTGEQMQRPPAHLGDGSQPAGRQGSGHGVCSSSLLFEQGRRGNTTCGLGDYELRQGSGAAKTAPLPPAAMPIPRCCLNWPAPGLPALSAGLQAIAPLRSPPLPSSSL